jgi:hypothetical protein
MEPSQVKESKPNFVEITSEHFNGGSGDTVTLYEVSKFIEKLYNEDPETWKPLSSQCSKNPFDDAVPGGSPEGRIIALKQTMVSEINHRDSIINDLKGRINELENGSKGR